MDNRDGNPKSQPPLTSGPEIRRALESIELRRETILAPIRRRWRNHDHDIDDAFGDVRDKEIPGVLERDGPLSDQALDHIVTTRVYWWLRKKHCRGKRQLAVALENFEQSPEQDPAAKSKRKDGIKFLWAKIVELKAVERQCIEARYFEGLSIKQCAARFNVTVSAFKMRLKRARQTLHQKLGGQSPLGGD